MEDDRLPLTRSLEVEVRTAFALPSQAEGLTGEALIEALATLQMAQDQTLLSTLANQGHELVASEPAAVLDWIDAVFARWQSHYSLDPEVAELLLAIRPLAAAFACSEDRFFTPGAHALHRLLDTLYEGFAGWSSDLGKTARPAVDAVGEIIQRCLQDFPSEPAVDHTLQLLEQKIGGYAGQLERLDAGLIEREATAMASAVARRAVGEQVSQKIGNATVPSKLAEFIGGDWFEAGVALAKNLGTDNDVWQQYGEITEQFVALFGLADTQFKVVAANGDELPHRVRKLLEQVGLSSERAKSAGDMLEYLLLRHASKQMLGKTLAPVMVDGQSTEEWSKAAVTSLSEAGIEQGQWYRIQQPEGVRRLRLCGAFGHNSYLVFMDFAGARALRLGTGEFANLLRSGEATQLDTRETFSRALVEAAEAKSEWLAGQQAAQGKAREQASQVAEQDAVTLASEREAAAQRLHDAEQRARGQSEALPASQSESGDRTLSADQPFDTNTVLQLQIPIGTWLGFHDREPPIMARVAVRDLDKDSYIFTNREGIKLRELTVPQLVTLIERDMVDILERKTSFRETLAGNAGQDRLNQFQAGPA
jgi:hypothetical protein